MSKIIVPAFALHALFTFMYHYHYWENKGDVLTHLFFKDLK